MTALDDALFLTWLKNECSYLDLRPLPGGRWAGISPLMYTHAIISGRIGNRFGYDDRWCFRDYAGARKALDQWDGSGEPAGWHRHPDTGRRRPEGAEALEYVTP